MTVRRIEYVTDLVDGRWEVQSVTYEVVGKFDTWDDADAEKEQLRRVEKDRQRGAQRDGSEVSDE